MGGRLAEAVRAAIDAAVDDPAAWATWDGKPVVRSKVVTGFPHRIVYLVGHDVVTIVAVAHAKRSPGYWRDRASL